MTIHRFKPPHRLQRWRPPTPGAVVRHTLWMLMAFSLCFAIAYAVTGCAGQGLTLDTDTRLQIPPLEPLVDEESLEERTGE